MQKQGSELTLCGVTATFSMLPKEKKKVVTHIVVVSIATAAGTWWNMVEEQRMHNTAGLQLERGTKTWMSS